MQKLLKWTLEAIREEDCFSWMEECRYEWTPFVKNTINQILEGKTILLLTDTSRQWFEKYILDNINNPQKSRPLLPVFPIAEIFPSIDSFSSTQDMEIFEDMLELSFPNGYLIWYIGKGDHPFTKLAYRCDNSFLWIMDEEVENSFSLRSSDEMLDIKLLQLYKLFDLTLSQALFGELDF
ncbi:MAG: HobA family DNA replication regulator [Sulfurovum sp.]|nr:HobA family DNA replication regulator [Sulfurovum sp.]MCB4744775.1 HobA family DNA replication regulator [Sulfurovum sp.]MCB4748454.1 HobA family DNA replication regulator [Sulfurovum sp.]MCB4751028.1 HobA family DNA replication regulator [Sulfurovum sp.]MCB4753561.1 HobA family DNA replication regulator [Sulfurovum sp.]